MHARGGLAEMHDNDVLNGWRERDFGLLDFTIHSKDGAIMCMVSHGGMYIAMLLLRLCTDQGMPWG